MQDALMDGTPMVVFTGQVPTSAIGSDAFQEADVIGISRPCTKWNTMVHKIEDLPRIIREAFYIATTGRPGPVLVDLPKDVTANVLRSPIPKRYPQLFRKRVLRSRNPMIRKACDAKEWKRSAPKVVEMINKAKRPVIYAGQGVIWGDAMTQLKDLAEKANIPVTTTLQGLGAFDEYHPLSLHMLGMHGSVLAIGARFDDRVTGRLDSFAPAARAASKRGEGGIVHIELLHKNIDKTVDVDVALEADCGEALDEIIPQLEFSERAEWLEMINTWKKNHPFSYEKNEGWSQCLTSKGELYWYQNSTGGTTRTDPRGMPKDWSLILHKKVVFEVLVDKKEHVYPMVPAGKSLDEMVLGPGQPM
eukprot:jgi/Bigna1/82062/fgenesh1_pg.87_\